MNLWFRLIWLRFMLRRAESMDLLATVSLSIRVWPTDLDIQRHMNNGRFLTIMDLGRYALMVRTGLWRTVRRQGWMTLVRGISIEYFKPLAPWQTCTLETRLVDWDDKWVYLEQCFRNGETIHARARVKGLMRGPNGNVRSHDLLAALGEADRHPPDRGEAHAGASG